MGRAGGSRCTRTRTLACDSISSVLWPGESYSHGVREVVEHSEPAPFLGSEGWAIISFSFIRDDERAFPGNVSVAASFSEMAGGMHADACAPIKRHSATAIQLGSVCMAVLGSVRAVDRARAPAQVTVNGSFNLQQTCSSTVRALQTRSSCAMYYVAESSWVCSDTEAVLHFCSCRFSHLCRQTGQRITAGAAVWIGRYFGLWKLATIPRTYVSC